MTTLTIRIDDQLKVKAAKEAAKLGLSLSFIVKNALRNFLESPKLVLGEPEIISLSPLLQKKVNKTALAVSKAIKKHDRRSS